MILLTFTVILAILIVLGLVPYAFQEPRLAFLGLISGIGFMILGLVLLSNGGILVEDGFVSTKQNKSGNTVETLQETRYEEIHPSLSLFFQVTTTLGGFLIMYMTYMKYYEKPKRTMNTRK